jgi:hypothetical protein
MSSWYSDGAIGVERLTARSSPPADNLFFASLVLLALRFCSGVSSSCSCSRPTKVHLEKLQGVACEGCPKQPPKLGRPLKSPPNPLLLTFLTTQGHSFIPAFSVIQEAK